MQLAHHLNDPNLLLTYFGSCCNAIFILRHTVMATARLHQYRSEIGYATKLLAAITRNNLTRVCLKYRQKYRGSNCRNRKKNLKEMSQRWKKWKLLYRHLNWELWIIGNLSLSLFLFLFLFLFLSLCRSLPLSFCLYLYMYYVSCFASISTCGVRCIRAGENSGELLKISGLL